VARSTADLAPMQREMLCIASCNCAPQLSLKLSVPIVCVFVPIQFSAGVSLLTLDADSNRAGEAQLSLMDARRCAI